jgi:predicted transcriptional regulator
MPYRDRLDIIADILSVVSSGNVKKTQILYQANLSYKILTKYLSTLTQASLIICSPNKTCFNLSARGAEFLSTYRKYYHSKKNAEKSLSIVEVEKELLDRLCPNQT